MVTLYSQRFSGDFFPSLFLLIKSTSKTDSNATKHGKKWTKGSIELLKMCFRRYCNPESWWRLSNDKRIAYHLSRLTILLTFCQKFTTLCIGTFDKESHLLLSLCKFTMCWWKELKTKTVVFIMRLFFESLFGLCCNFHHTKTEILTNNFALFMNLVCTWFLPSLNDMKDRRLNFCIQNNFKINENHVFLLNFLHNLQKRIKSIDESQINSSKPFF